ncbi:hypothetical protein JCM10212_004169 [Sporobolomyces blumeae]
MSTSQSMLSIQGGAYPIQQESFPNPNVQGNPYIYLAVYSSVAVYEMMVRGIGVMRRQEDSWLNATQILKVAGVDKGKRTKFLEKDIAQGVHEKIQGGYGRYQGTWIPFERAVELANAFNVAHLLAPLFDYTPPPPPVALNGAAPPPPIVNPYAPDSGTMSTPLPAPISQQQQRQLPAPPQHQHSYSQHLPPQSAQDVLMQARQQGLIPEASPAGSPMPSGPSSGQGIKRQSEPFEQEDLKRTRMEATNGFHAPGAQAGLAQGENGFHPPDQPLPSASTSATNFRTTLKKSTKSSIDFSTVDPNLVESQRQALKGIFSLESDAPANSLAPPPVPDLSSHLPVGIDPDTPIDENSHTALHWAAALARISIVHALVNFGSDLHRGNNVGETPLIRAILVTNNSDQDSFGRLLEVLGPSLRTVDDSGRSVLHHAALVAGVKGRASSAQYYLELILEHIARNEKGQFGDLIDAQDSHGDTALNIAARVGNRALVRMLLDVGADKYKPNKLGLRPTDFGVEDPDLVANPAEETLRNLASPPANAPLETSTEVLRSINEMVNSLSETFSAELATKVEFLDAKKAQLQNATQDLAAARSQISQARSRARLIEDKRLRIENLERALEEEDSFDWTGRTEVDGTPASQLAGPGFAYRGPASTLTNLPAGISIEFDTDPPAPSGDEGTSLVHLLRLQSWYERVEGLLKQRIERLEGGNQELESKLQRIVADCCGVEADKVGTMLEGLVRSLEADPSAQDLSRIAGFLSRVKNGQ